MSQAWGSLVRWVGQHPRVEADGAVRRLPGGLIRPSLRSDKLHVISTGRPPVSSVSSTDRLCSAPSGRGLGVDGVDAPRRHLRAPHRNIADNFHLPSTTRDT